METEFLLLPHVGALIWYPIFSVDVIINTVCPGLVHSDIGRSIANVSWKTRLFVFVYLNALGKTTDYGARLYLTAARTPPQEHGKFLVSLFIEKEYRELAEPNLRSETASSARELVRNGIIHELRHKLPGCEALKNYT